ncbi:fungal-specific transcription factor domain-containing protein [Cristinia sonorae]|uniref:Fungal-specific transcription factor domain-containing protein n=1 Tax=Cristinia sonorae TaxID=1940300 RepID=A0A8K0XKB1_9AGAR|nr:fungal-specific transcription factor domain-containing protein [Cristinia sonorae]
MTYATTNTQPGWLLPASSSASPTIIDLGDRPSLSDPSHTSSAALNASSNINLPPLKASFSDSYYALDSSDLKDRSKKRKIERACDFCRRRKTKCDGPKLRGYTCTNCTQNGRECTYNEASKPRGPPKAYVNGLEDRVEKLEVLLRRLRPEIYFSDQVGPPIVRGSWKNESPPPTKTATHAPLIPRLPTTSSLQSSSLIPPAPSFSAGAVGSSQSGGPVTIALSNPLPNPISAKPSRDSLKTKPSMVFSDYEDLSSASSSEDEDYGELSLIRGMQGMSLGSSAPLEGTDHRGMADSQWRFHGKSSSFKLINTARKLQQLHMDSMPKPFRDGKSDSGSPPVVGSHRRKQFWTSPPWETNLGDSRPKFSGTLESQWPDMDLAQRLIDMYFTVMNPLFPLLHRPTFQRQFQDRLYERDVWFACLCMSLFAVASRWCHDPRVLMPTDTATPPDESDPVWNSAGWKYIAVAIELQNSSYTLTLPPSLFEVQMYHNIGLFLRGTTVYTDAWTFVSIGLRKAQDIGAHRKSVYGPVPTVEGELWKRAYWQLASFDAISSMILGRPCASRDEDFDLEMPLEVDDEYWENDDPALAFQQPKGKPSTVSAFSCWIRLTRIAAHALRTLYALEKSKAPLGLVGPRWREETVERLNDAMGDWLESIPTHLRWSNAKNQKDIIITNSSATLITTYYMVQIVAHRPFIPMPTSGSLAGFQNRKNNHAVRPDFPWKCLAICTNAAKATSEIVESYAHHVMNKNIASLANCCYIAAGVLLVHLWILKAMERENVMPEGGKTALDERMKDVTGTLEKLMARLEEIAPKLEVAAMWLGEIKESLPTLDVPPTDTLRDEDAMDVKSGPEEQQFMVPSEPYAQPEASTHSSMDVPLESSNFNAQYGYPSQEARSTHPSLQQRVPKSHVYGHVPPPFPPAAQQQWERQPSDQDTSHVRDHRPPTGTPSTPSSMHGEMHHRPQGYIPSLRHHSSSSSIHSSPYDMSPPRTNITPESMHRPEQENPLPPWYVFQNTTAPTNPPVYGHYTHEHSSSSPYVHVKPEESPTPLLSDARRFAAPTPAPASTPAILPPFYAPATSVNVPPGMHQGPPPALQRMQSTVLVSTVPTSVPEYGQPWEYTTYRPDISETWRETSKRSGNPNPNPMVPQQYERTRTTSSASVNAQPRMMGEMGEGLSYGSHSGIGNSGSTEGRQHQHQQYQPPRQY